MEILSDYKPNISLHDLRSANRILYPFILFSIKLTVFGFRSCLTTLPNGTLRICIFRDGNFGNVPCHSFLDFQYFLFRLPYLSRLIPLMSMTDRLLYCPFSERTFTAPQKWMRGKGRITIQFGCCYNYAMASI